MANPPTPQYPKHVILHPYATARLINAIPSTTSRGLIDQCPPNGGQKSSKPLQQTALPTQNLAGPIFSNILKIVMKKE